MASERANQMAQRYASVRERTSKPDLDLATRRDIDESLHSLAREPERVSFAEVDADSGTRQRASHRKVETGMPGRGTARSTKSASRYGSLPNRQSNC